MKQRSFLPIVVITAVVALVLGSIGTAVAGPALTKGKVKAIATKVVKKQAPTLSVAHAATAGSAATAANATNLNGEPSSAYRNPSTTYKLPVQAAARRAFLLAERADPRHLPGDLQRLHGRPAQEPCRTAGCTTPRPRPLAESWLYGTNYSAYNTQTGSTVIAVGATAPRVYCEASVPWTIYAGAETDSRVTVTRLDDLATGRPPGPSLRPASRTPTWPTDQPGEDGDVWLASRCEWTVKQDAGTAVRLGDG